KAMVSAANRMVKGAKGTVVFIDDDNDLMYKLDRMVRFIDASEFGIDDLRLLRGFICGIVSQNYDIETVFIDGLNYIANAEPDGMADIFSFIEGFSERFGIGFIISINGEEGMMPEFLRPFYADVGGLEELKA
ncbi:MAG: hypothetical protein FWE70_05715, partial [Oscillospiraceae bacterium]|nr:hypothetical protein [Oscillospiraceae bacterium]